MYKKKNRKPLVIMMVIALICLGAAFGIPKILGNRRAEEPETEQQISKHEVLLYKTNAASIEFDSSWLKTDQEAETILEIATGTLVSFNVTPVKGRTLESVDVVDHDFRPVTSMLREATEDTVRVTFTMPDMDVIVNFNFTESDNEKIQETPAEEKEEIMTEHTSPYGLTLHGVTADIITSYNGQFDDQEFLQQLGDTLHIDSPRSDYSDVTDVTFSSESYEREVSTDKVSYYIYFNEDPQRKMLSTYYRKDDAYVFTEVEEESETEEEKEEAASAGSSSQSGTVTYSTPGTGGGSYGYSISQETITTSFDILQVSTTFLAYTGDQDTFYEQAFQYILKKGLTGTIVGTMSSYEIHAEKQKADFKITLNVGGAITGTYNKAKNSYKFSGL